MRSSRCRSVNTTQPLGPIRWVVPHSSHQTRADSTANIPDVALQYTVQALPLVRWRPGSLFITPQRRQRRGHACVSSDSGEKLGSAQLGAQPRARPHRARARAMGSHATLERDGRRETDRMLRESIFCQQDCVLKARNHHLQSVPRTKHMTEGPRGKSRSFTRKTSLETDSRSLMTLVWG